MKTKIALFTISCAVILASCGGEQTEVPVTVPEAVQDTTPQMEIDTFKIETNASEVKWSGEKVIGGKHNGFIRLSNGWFGFSEGKLVKGEMIIDMTSIVNLDLTKEEDKKKLVDHLKSKDFFSVDSFPTAKFVITSATDSTVSGDLTLKNITKPVSFSYSIPVKEKTFLLVQSQKFSIDRTKWGVTYNNASIPNIAKDRIINDQMELQISLNAVK